MRKVFSIIFYVLGGLYLSGLAIVGFMSFPEIGVSMIPEIFIGAFGLVLFLIGLAIDIPGRRKRSTAIALISVAGLSLLQSIWMITIHNSPEFMKAMPPGMNINALPSTTTMIFVPAVAALGWWLLRSSKADKLNVANLEADNSNALLASEEAAMPVEFYHDDERPNERL